MLLPSSAAYGATLIWLTRVYKIAYAVARQPSASLPSLAVYNTALLDCWTNR